MGFFKDLMISFQQNIPSVLVIDDDEAVVHALVNVVRKASLAEYDYTTDPIEFFELYHDHGPYSLLIIDVNMPVGGFEVVRKIKDLKQPILLLSGMKPEIVQASIKREGLDEWNIVGALQKPVFAHRLRQILKGL